MTTIDGVLSKGYLGNNKLRRPNTPTKWSIEQQQEFFRCAHDPEYFMEKYIKIIHVDKGIINFEPRQFQKDIITKVVNNRFVIVNTCRQAGKSTAVAATVLHHIVFNSGKTAAILANKGETAREILKRVQFAYENLPKWMQHGVVEYNKGSFELENGSRVLAAASSASAIRGYSISLLVLDEAAHLDNWAEFFASVYPTISSGEESKIVMVSTPNGYNHFYSFWRDANEDINGFKHVKVTWRDIPERNNPEWEKRERAILGDEKFEQEHNCEFLGSVMTLISPTKLKTMRAMTPLANNKNLKIYTPVIMDTSQYVLVADVSHGKGLDYHAFSVFDVTQQPYAQVAAFRDNRISPIEYGELIFRTGVRFNNALVLVELNDMGIQVSRVIKHDLEYENIIHTVSKGRSGQIPCYWHPKGEAGVRTSVTTKAIGCNMLKHLIEHNILIINDDDTIKELTTFVRSDKARESFCAQTGKNDDTVTPLFLFGWLVNSQFFQNITDVSIRDQLRADALDDIEQMSAPVGFIQDGITETNEPVQIDPTDKDRWLLAS